MEMCLFVEQFLKGKALLECRVGMVGDRKAKVVDVERGAKLFFCRDVLGLDEKSFSF